MILIVLGEIQWQNEQGESELCPLPNQLHCVDALHVTILTFIL